jgi:hypothetical protein
MAAGLGAGEGKSEVSFPLAWQNNRPGFFTPAGFTRSVLFEQNDKLTGCDLMRNIY